MKWKEPAANRMLLAWMKTSEYVFVISATPIGRRNVCYDHEAEETRKKKGVYPEGNAMDMAAAMGIELLTEEQYRELQKLGEFDTKTSSWLKTPSDIRKLGGAIFGDCRYGHVFIYHNSAPSFYSARISRIIKGVKHLSIVAGVFYCIGNSS